MIFNAMDSDGDFFQYIKVYDSLSRNYNKKRRILQVQNPAAITLLKKYQQFFINYILYDTDHKEMLNNPDYILQDVTYHECPVQENSYDCGLFAFGIMQHLVRSINITSKSYRRFNLQNFYGRGE
jgi:Ulp1 family protease